MAWFSSPSGMTDRPICKSCGSPTSIVRREPHPTLGTGYELQTTACAMCDRYDMRSVDARGVVIATADRSIRPRTGPLADKQDPAPATMNGPVPIRIAQNF